MNQTRVNDPARAVLARILTLTVEKNRFPKESILLGKGGTRRDALQRLLEDRRYLARVVACDAEGLRPPRLP